MRKKPKENTVNEQKEEVQIKKKKKRNKREPKRGSLYNEKKSGSGRFRRN